MASASKTGRKVGRPAQIGPEAIAEAIAGMPVEAVTMQSVASALGVSAPSLYHWVGSREQLVALAVDQAAERVGTPEARGQHWSVWLFEWADHARRAFVREPELLRQFSSGTLGLARMLEAIDTALSLLVDQGFSEQDAVDAFYLVSQSAVGAAVAEVREQRMAADGHAVDDEFNRLLERRPATELTHLRQLAAEGGSMHGAFEEKIVTVLVGLAVRRGADLSAVIEHLERHVSATGGHGHPSR